MSDYSRPLTFEDCEAIVHNFVFCFRKQEYHKQYPKWPGQIGLELETLVYRARDFKQDRALLAPLYNGAENLASVLEKFAAANGFKCNLSSDIQGTDLSSDPKLLSLNLDDEDQITFEPGGQLEYSSKPYPCLGDALKRLQNVQANLGKHLAQHELQILQTGINPWQTEDEIGLQMRKPRYLAMDKYFTKISPYGRQMMRQTCTIQVNLDFGDCDTTLAKRYLAANYLAPFATAIFAYSPFHNRKVTPFASYRSNVWRHIDNSRTGIVDNLQKLLRKMDKNTCVEIYLKDLLAARVIFVEGANYQVPDTETTFADWLKNPIAGVKPTEKDFMTHMSLHFPEVRARGFLELRSVDAQARQWQAVPPAFYTALLYDEKNLDWILETFEAQLPKLNKWLPAAARGLEDPEIASFAKQLVEQAIGGLDRLPPCFQGDGLKKNIVNFYENFTLRNRCPADDLRDWVRTRGFGNILPSNFISLEDYWRSEVK